MKSVFYCLVFIVLSTNARADVNVWAQFAGVYNVVSVVNNGLDQQPHTAKIIVGGVTDAWYLTWWNPAPAGTGTQKLALGQDPARHCSEPLKSCELQTSVQMGTGKIKHTYIRTYEGVSYEDETLTFEDKGSGQFEMVEEWKTGKASFQIYTLQKE